MKNKTKQNKNEVVNCNNITHFAYKNEKKNSQSYKPRASAKEGKAANK